MQDVFADAMEQLLGAFCSPAVVREIERGAGRQPNEAAASLWSELIASGFADAWIPENRGGAGLSLPDIFSIVLACGRHALPLPFAHTLLARGLLSAQACPVGAITIANAARELADGSIECAQTPFGLTADWVVVDLPSRVLLLPVGAASRAATGVHGSLDADLRWSAMPADHRVLPRDRDWRTLGATICAALMAGALEQVLELTLNYANERSQFGKPIGKFQAIQQQLSVMAEDVFAAKMAAQIAFAATRESVLPAAVAKARASEAAPRVAASAHAVHGAMGFTEEYDLQLYTRRLHEWRMAYGAEQFWNQKLGQAVLEREGGALDFIRQTLFAATTTES